MAAPHADVSDVQVETKAEEVDTSASQTEAETLAKLEETRLSEEETARGDEARAFFRKYLNRNLKVEITDGRILIGIFLCTDRDANVVLGSCKEYASPKSPLAGIKKEKLSTSTRLLVYIIHLFV
jgi:small nuclear ribonucleoprotein (snRNP)-like protein